MQRLKRTNVPIYAARTRVSDVLGLMRLAATKERRSPHGQFTPKEPFLDVQNVWDRG